MSGFIGGLPLLPAYVGAIVRSHIQQQATQQYPSNLPQTHLKWGIFTSLTPSKTPTVSPNGAPSAAPTEVLTGYNTVVGFDFSVDAQLPTYPVEQGGFSSYNKVQLPFGARLQYAVSGGAIKVNQFLLKALSLEKDTNLYTVLTPVQTLQNVNVKHVDYKQTSRAGITLLTVNVWLDEIRQTATSTTPISTTGNQISATQTRTPSAQAQTQSGVVQTQAAISQLNSLAPAKGSVP